VDGAAAVLLGPWLGANVPRAAALSAAVGLPCGEALAGVGAAPGLRFEAARHRLLESIGARRVRDRAARVVREDGGAGFAIFLEAGETKLAADAVVLAVGGLAAGGLVYAPPEHAAGASLPPLAKVPFELSVEAPVVLSTGESDRMDVIASMHGPELDLRAWPVLESVGIRCEHGLAAPGVYAAGDVVAGRPRTMLEAVESGLAAAKALAAEALTR
jgi:glycerol-3-phosphate dehydrogenase subunit B